MTAHHSDDRIEEAAREIADTMQEWEDLPIYEGIVICMEPILQRLYDDGKKAGAAFWVDAGVNAAKRVMEMRDELARENAKLREALEKLVTHSRHCDCSTCDGQFADYHAMARAALDPSSTGTK